MSKPHAAHPAAVGDRLELPHERDQSTHGTAATPDPGMRQAHQDLKQGQVDTDMRATPGLDAGRRTACVPGAGGTPPSQKAPPSSPTAPRKNPRR